MLANMEFKSSTALQQAMLTLVDELQLMALSTKFSQVGFV